MVKKKIKKKKEMEKVILWAPRVLMIIYIAMINALILPKGLSEITKLIPVVFLLIFLIIAWQWEIVGGSIIIALGFIFGIFFGGLSSLSGFGFLVLPLWMIGLLFLLSNKINS